MNTGNQGAMCKLTSADYLKFALIKLIGKKNVRFITVKELCMEAQINRSTFYANYENLDMFYDQLMRNTAKGLVDIVTNNGRNNSLVLKQGKAYGCYCEWFTYIRDNSDIFRAFLGKNGFPEFRDILVIQGVGWYTKLLKPMMADLDDKVSVDVLANYIVNAHQGLMTFYLDSGMKYSPEYMASQLTLLTFSGPISLLRLFSD